MRDFLTYYVTITESGKWLYASDSNFLFTFVPNRFSSQEKKKITDAFEETLKLFSLIRKAVVEKVDKGAVVNNLYLIDQDKMTKAMNSIEGMGMTSVDKSAKEANGTVASINLVFFNDILSSLGGEVDPMQKYLLKKMESIQSDARSAQADYVQKN